MAGQASKQSQFHNVYWYRRTGRWIVKLHARGNPSGRETIDLGYYDDEIEAAKVADVATRLVRGPDARSSLNFYPYRLPETICRAAIIDIVTKHGAALFSLTDD